MDCQDNAGLQAITTKTPLREKILSLGVISVLAMAAASYFIYFSVVLKSESGGPDAWGQFGDFIGGVVNPVVGVATVLLVAATLRETRYEAQLTRDEMKLQHKAMNQQLEHLKKETHLADLRARLEGALTAWNFSLDIPAVKFFRGSATGIDDKVHLDNSQRTYRAHLYDPYLYNEISKITRGDNKDKIWQIWNTNLQIFVQLLDEFSTYCAQYDAQVGNKMLTDFYRHRIQAPLRVFHVLELVDRAVVEELRVSLTFRDRLHG